MGEKKGWWYTKTENVIIDHYLPLLGTGPYSLWSVMRRRCNKDMVCYITLRSLAKALNLTHDRDVLAYRQPLLDAGLVEILRKGHSSGRATYYKLLIPDTTLLSFVHKVARKLRINGRKKKITASYGSNPQDTPLPYMAKGTAVDGSANTAVDGSPTRDVRDYNKRKDLISRDKPKDKPKEEYLGQKYLAGKSSEELQALEIRARKELQEAGTTDERIIRAALRTHMALIAKEEMRE